MLVWFGFALEVKKGAFLLLLIFIKFLFFKIKFIINKFSKKGRRKEGFVKMIEKD